MKTDAQNLVVMGRVVAPYGVKGWLKVIPDTEEFDTLLDYATWWIGKDAEWHELALESAKTHNDVLVVKLQGIDDRDSAFACKGKLVAVPRASLPELDDNEFYWSDLIGLTVKNQQAIVLGTIASLFETGANDVMVVQDVTTKRERLIPFIAQTVLDVDMQNRIMQVDWDEDF